MPTTKTIKDKAKTELTKLSFPRQWMAEDDLEDEGKFLRRSFRCPEYFTSGREDDDDPEFTGRDEALVHAKKHFSSDVLNQYSLSIYNEGEKSWMVVSLKKKETPAGA